MARWVFLHNASKRRDTERSPGDPSEIGVAFQLVIVYLTKLRTSGILIIQPFVKWRVVLV